MSKSEDIRLSIGQVRHKKSDGTLYLMAERLAWMPDNERSSFTISHRYADIKMQKISPEGKAKIQLQIVLHTGETTTFQFENIEDRTAVKDSLLQILPQFKGKVPKERERKALILSKNPSLLELYKELVETNIITSDQFWTQFVDEKSSPTDDLHDELQEVGVSGDFMAGIPLNGKQIKGSVTVETLWAILRTYPKVAQKHQELVPSKMTESEFWNKFFQSRYFHRDRTRDVFTDCAKSDEKEWSAGLKRSVEDPFYNLDMFHDNAYNQTVTKTSSDKDNPNSILIKRFNQHSIKLLETLTRSQQKDIPSVSTQVKDESVKTSGSPQQSTSVPMDIPEDNATSFKAHRKDWSYDDLMGQEVHGDFLIEQIETASRELNVDKDRYAIVPAIQQGELSADSLRSHITAIKNWYPKLTECLSSANAVEALKDLSPGGALMKSTNINNLDNSIPEELKEKLRSIYYGSNEILRHFWMCFPVVEPRLEQKLITIYETLKKFEATRLQPLYDSLPRDKRHLLNHIIGNEFKEAHRRYDSWKVKSSV